MQIDTKRYQDLTEEEKLAHHEKMMKYYENGLWAHIHGVTLKPVDSILQDNPNAKRDK